MQSAVKTPFCHQRPINKANAWKYCKFSLTEDTVVCMTDCWFFPPCDLNASLMKLFFSMTIYLKAWNKFSIVNKLFTSQFIHSRHSLFHHVYSLQTPSLPSNNNQVSFSTHRQRISFNMDPVFLILLRASLCVQSSQLTLLIDLTSNPSTIPAVAALLLGVTYGITTTHVSKSNN